ncbi:MAG: GNAT family N-acetyltransferase, partial [Nanoarchaeota archaeon]|nr:GNAT family N-acetyltransferase [Nanoarchaeota archaeon]
LIKRAILKNIPEIVAIHKNCVLKTNANFYSKEVINEWIDQISEKSVNEQFKNSSWYILLIKNKIIGFAQFSLNDGELYQININSRYQNRGYGKLLYDFIEKQFKKNHNKKIFLNSTLNAFEFYKALGFKSLGEIKFKLNKYKIKMIKMKKLI